MDLMTAKKDAAARSLQTTKTVFVDLGGDGECSIAEKQSEATMHAFKDGKEIPLPAEATEKVDSAPAKKPSTKKSSTKNKKKMATEAKAKPAKKAPAKKKAAPAKKEKATAGPKLIGKATTLLLTADQWKKVHAAAEKKGTTIREMASVGIMKAL